MSGRDETRRARGFQAPPSGALRTARLQLVPRRTPRSETAFKAGENLSRMALQLAELQRQFGRQVGTLEDSIQQQRRELLQAMGQLPEMKARMNCLMAGFGRPS